MLRRPCGDSEAETYFPGLFCRLPFGNLFQQGGQKTFQIAVAFVRRDIQVFCCRYGILQAVQVL